MEGGINAWNGLVASGAPEAGMAYFSDKDRPEEIIVLAWLLEEGARRYYKGIEELMEDNKSKTLFKELSAAEVHHKSLLVRLYKELSGSGTESELPEAFATEELSEVMEGGMRISEALKWAKGKDLKDILDFSIAMETNSYDLYIKMERTINGADSKKVFRALYDEEKSHLDRLIALLEERP